MKCSDNMASFLIALQLKKDRKPEEIEIGGKIEDVTDILTKSSSKIIKELLIAGDCYFKAVRVRGFAGIIGLGALP